MVDLRWRDPRAVRHDTDVAYRGGVWRGSSRGEGRAAAMPTPLEPHGKGGESSVTRGVLPSRLRTRFVHLVDIPIM